MVVCGFLVHFFRGQVNALAGYKCRTTAEAEHLTKPAQLRI